MQLDLLEAGQCIRNCDDKFIAYYCKDCEVKWRGCGFEQLCWECLLPAWSYRKILTDNKEVI